MLSRLETGRKERKEFRKRLVLFVPILFLVCVFSVFGFYLMFLQIGFSSIVSVISSFVMTILSVAYALVFWLGI